MLKYVFLEPSTAPDISCTATRKDVIQCQTNPIPASEWNGASHGFEVLHRAVRHIPEDQLEMDVSQWNLEG